jgi:putative cofactor-binding repeat protein
VSSPLITGNIIEDCFALNDGGGLYCASSRVVIDGNTIRYNSAGIPLQGTKDLTNGGGICLTGGGSGVAVVSNNIITDNYSVDYGGGITCTRNTLITGNQIIDNQSGWFGGGIYHLNASGTILHENLISGNTSLWGAGITLQGGHLTVTKCEILNNVGDGLHIYYGTLNADSSTFANNTGDGIGCGSSKIPGSRGASVHYCSITDNDGFGIRNSNAWFSLDATLNWWGDQSGPGGEGPGTGDEVSKLVEYDPWLIQMGIAGGSAGDTPENTSCILTANPVRSSTTLIIDGSNHAELVVLDLSGRVVQTLFSGIPGGCQSVNWNVSELASGMYFLCIVEGDELSTRSVTVIR